MGNFHVNFMWQFTDEMTPPYDMNSFHGTISHSKIDLSIPSSWLRAVGTKLAYITLCFTFCSFWIGTCSFVKCTELAFTGGSVLQKCIIIIKACTCEYWCIYAVLFSLFSAFVPLIFYAVFVIEQNMKLSPIENFAHKIGY